MCLTPNAPVTSLQAAARSDAACKSGATVCRASLLESSDDLIGAKQEILGDPDADHTRHSHVNNQLVPGHLLDRQLGRFRAFENLVHEDGRTLSPFLYAWTVRHKRPVVGTEVKRKYGGKSNIVCRLGNLELICPEQ